MGMLPGRLERIAMKCPLGDQAAAFADLYGALRRRGSGCAVEAIQRSVSKALAFQSVRLRSQTTRAPSGEMAGADIAYISSD